MARSEDARAAAVRSRENPLFQRLRRLATSARARREEGNALLDGAHLVTAWRETRRPVDLLVASESGLDRAEVAALFDRTTAAERVILADALFDAVAQVVTPAGILAVVRTPVPEALPAAPVDCVLLEGVQDPGNVGSILRSAAAAGIRHILFDPACAAPWSPKVLRAGQGAHFVLALHERQDLAAFGGAFKGILATTQPRGGETIYEVDLSGPVAWAFGAEGSGVSAALAAACRLRLSIPMPGGVESLNVAAAAAICLFEQVRQRTARGTQGA
jgi:TrmH family RNA methyltransferase